MKGLVYEEATAIMEEYEGKSKETKRRKDRGMDGQSRIQVQMGTHVNKSAAEFLEVQLPMKEVLERE